MKNGLLLVAGGLLPLLQTSANPLPNPNPSIPDLLDSLLNPNPGHGGSDSITPPGPGYTLTWHDEFTSPSSSSSESGSGSGSNHLPSSSNWLFSTGTQYPAGAPNWGNNELQSYTTSPSNIHLTPQGTLLITPLRDTNNHWTSARIETQRTSFAARRSGKLYIESRLRTGCALPSQQSGIWPAFWALGESFRADPTDWPMASEWDFVEVINGEPTVYNNLHCGVDREMGGPCNEYTGLTNGGVRWSGCEWHTVGFEVDREVEGGDWEDETLTWFLDGVESHRVSGADVGDEGVWESIAHRGHFLLLNVAVGGNWPGYPDENTVDGEEVAMEVDYVRVWNAN
ncbi:concanavalin A-like lectin/glucanase domain-containing protein [Aspergillus pseudodeflectus]|uniref:Concanavalin A-like lectin/glucanase domain-containing protein n=1 Tax=Aspergillus pseudodeflectus TaxID=176178 RepID=A0ABR4JXD3_9EURO